MTHRMVRETKTSSEDVSEGSTFWKRLRIDPQIPVYIDGASFLGLAVLGVWYDVLRKPMQQPLLATPVESRQYTKKTGELYKNQRLEDETSEEFEARCIEVIKAEPDRYYKRGTIVRLDDEMRESRLDRWHTASSIRDARRLNMWPRNPDACVQWGRTCDYFSVCTGTASIDDPYLFEVLEDAHEELDVGGKDLLTQSSMRCYRSCPSRYHKRYELRVRPLAQKAKTLRVGTSVHAGVEVYWRTGDVEQALSGLVSEDPYDRARERAMLKGYAAMWGPPPAVSWVEKEFRMPLINPETGAASRTFEVGGRIDAICEVQ